MIKTHMKFQTSPSGPENYGGSTTVIPNLYEIELVTDLSLNPPGP